MSPHHAATVIAQAIRRDPVTQGLRLRLYTRGAAQAPATLAAIDRRARLIVIVHLRLP